MSDATSDLLRRQQDALGRINAAIAKGDQREIKAWRTAHKRINFQLRNAGYRHEPVEKPE